MPPVVTTVLLFFLGAFLASWGIFAIFHRRHPYDAVGALCGPVGLFVLLASALSAFAPGFWSCG